ncbi:MAG TPA: hypothetical protein VMY39_09635, partial [Planctomycetota bacterium]|nr:hypothetical protein [Planctomycetota bacterium]
LQYVIDAVDPSKPTAPKGPKKIAALLKKHIDASLDALGRYRRAAGAAKADEIARYIRRNAALGEFTRREILAALHLYAVYFAKSKRAIVSKLRKGLAEFAEIPKVLRLDEKELARIRRALLNDRFETARPLKLLRATLRAVERTDFPVDAYVDYLASRREYNEIRRVVRPLRSHNRTTVGYAVAQLERAIRKAKDALAALGAPRHRKLAANVEAWLRFLERELARTTPPRAVCSTRPGEFLPLCWDHAFRAGEDFAEDFLGFFRPMPLEPESHLSFRVWRTSGALAVEFRETDIDPAQRKAQWERYRGSGSDSFVERIFIDTEGRGRSREMYIVWPTGESVSAGTRPRVKVKTAFVADDSSTTTTVWLPWSLVGKRPAKGDVWRLNVTGNPAILRNRAFTWAPQYDAGGNATLFGKVRFV